MKLAAGRPAARSTKPDAMTEPKTFISVRVDERTRRETEAHLHQLGLSASQLFSVLLERIGHDEGVAMSLVVELDRLGSHSKLGL